MILNASERIKRPLGVRRPGHRERGCRAGDPALSPLFDDGYFLLPLVSWAKSQHFNYKAVTRHRTAN